jgi:hypothetical protein
MFSLSVRISPMVVVLLALAPAMAQRTDVTQEKLPAITQQTIDELIARLAAHEARIKELEEKLAQQNSASVQKPQSAVSQGRLPVTTITASPEPMPVATSEPCSGSA